MRKTSPTTYSIARLISSVLAAVWVLALLHAAGEHPNTPLETFIARGIPRVETYHPRDTGVRGTIHQFSNLPNGELAILTSVGLFSFDGTNWERVDDMDWTNRNLLLPEKNESIIAYRDGLARVLPDAFGSYYTEDITTPDNYNFGLPSLEFAAFARHSYFGLAGNHLVIAKPDGTVSYQLLPNWATTCFAIGDEVFVTGGRTTLLNRWDWEKNELVNATHFLDSSGVYEWMTDIAPRSEGGVWILTQGNRIISFDGTTSELWPGSQVIEQLGVRITSFAEVSPDTLALGTSTNGLLVVDRDAKTILNYSKAHGLDDVNINQVGVDTQGGIWIATENSITRVPSQSLSLLFNENHGLAEDITSLAIFDDHLYIGTAHGLFVDNPNSSQMSDTFVKIREHLDIQDMIVVDEHLFISGETTLVMDEHQNFSLLDSVGCTNLHQPSKFPGVILAGTYRGVHRYDLVDGQWTFTSELEGPEQNFYSIAEDAHGNLIGSLGNNFVAHIQLTDTGGAVTNIPLPNPTNGQWTTPVNIEGSIYVNTNPIVRWEHESQSFVSDPEMYYYPGSPPYGFEQVFGRNGDHAFVALNARSGVTLPRPNKQIIGDISSVGYSIDTRAVCVAQGKDGYIWAGGRFGVILANTQQTSADTRPYKPRLNRIILSKSKKSLPIIAPEDNPIILEHSQNSIYLDVEFPKFTATDHHQYQIHVEGLDQGWGEYNDAKQRELNNLAPGDYILQVNTIDASGQNYEGDQYFITILKPWYLEHWAYILYLLSGTAIVAAIVRYYNRVQINRSRQLQLLVLERTKEIEAKNSELQSQAAILEKQNEELEEKTEELLSTTDSLTATLHQLHDMQDQLVATARTAGKAEIATNVLHNVGNVLNSINVSLTVLNQRISESKVEKLSKLAELVQNHMEDIDSFLTQDSRGKQIPNYIVHLSAALRDECAAMAYELNTMEEDVDHVKRIIAAQQTHAKSRSVNSTFKLRDILETAQTILERENNQFEIEVVNDIDPNLTIEGDKHRILEIVLNLFSNAQESIIEQRPDLGILSLSSELDEAQENVTLRVTDNGRGIDPENQPQIFTHGFTTKAEGHGFGLHSSANIANSLGGRLNLSSEGLGKGATATLTLPLRPKQEAGTKKAADTSQTAQK